MDKNQQMFILIIFSILAITSIIIVYFQGKASLEAYDELTKKCNAQIIKCNEMITQCNMNNKAGLSIEWWNYTVLNKTEDMKK